MGFNVEIKIDGNTLVRGDLFYVKRRLYRVEHVGKPRGKQNRFTVKLRLVGKINLDRERRKDRA
ncbi:MAG TPA: hypothetical protein VHX11_07780 [Acidobacteriaceae bacterium]|jgi:hypothetical protein|nr:hypothetical protein [Acidobacteriaceae bacterium]